MSEEITPVIFFFLVNLIPHYKIHSSQHSDEQLKQATFLKI